jgi:hypothetical protein
MKAPQEEEAGLLLRAYTMSIGIMYLVRCQTAPFARYMWAYNVKETKSSPDAIMSLVIDCHGSKESEVLGGKSRQRSLIIKLGLTEGARGGYSYYRNSYRNNKV